MSMTHWWQLKNENCPYTWLYFTTSHIHLSINLWSCVCTPSNALLFLSLQIDQKMKSGIILINFLGIFNSKDVWKYASLSKMLGEGDATLQ